MKTRLSKFSWLLAVATVLFGCNPEEEELTEQQIRGELSENTTTGGTCETVTFDKYTVGKDGFVNAVMSDQASTPIYVSAYRRTAPNTYASTNVANIFNSAQPTPIPDVNEIDDILTPHKDFGGGGVGAGGAKGSAYANNAPLGNLMIINRTNDASKAYDSNSGGKMVFDFSGYGTVTLSYITVLDVDSYEKGGKVVLYGLGGKVLKTVELQVSGDNGKQVVNLGNTAGVVKMEVYLGPGGISPNGKLSGSGAIDNIVFNCMPPQECETITFNRYVRGTDGFISYVTSDQSTKPIYVSAYRRTAPNTYNSPDVANIFNSGQPTPIPDVNQIDDILTPNQDFSGGGVGEGGEAGSKYANDMPLGNTFIINRTNNPAQAYDSNTGGKMEFNFSSYGTVSLTSVTVIDVDSYEAGGRVVLYGSGGNVLKTVMFQVSGDNGKQIVDLGGTSGVARMVIYLGPDGISPNGNLSGSGTIDNIVFNCPPPPPTHYGCTYTQGYWKNHATGKKRDATWGDLADTYFYGSGLTYLQLLNTPPKGGNAYIILAHQYIAAKLNMMQASSTPEVDAAFAAATAYFSATAGGNYRNTISNPYVTVQRSTLISWSELFTRYNEGHIGPGHCDKDDNGGGGKDDDKKDKDKGKKDKKDKK
ncbi:hypothetical protein [Sabulibacter ruber]|uniref:hypothetical protein n=1 Tax=Sabulibacter ruber TaxID=2811901 RepID=UPI001A95AFD3|nr:hypothetical protein [Sabulibacter ruber]